VVLPRNGGNIPMSSWVIIELPSDLSVLVINIAYNEAFPVLTNARDIVAAITKHFCNQLADRDHQVNREKSVEITNAINKLLDSAELFWMIEN
jgi:hypothetical protein